MKLSLQHYSQKFRRECLMNWLQCSSSDFFLKLLEEEHRTILIITSLFDWSWQAGVATYPNSQLPACQFTCLPNFWCSVSLSDNVSQKCLWVTVLLQARLRPHEDKHFKHLATSAFRGTNSGSNISFPLLPSGRISILDFQAQTPFSAQRYPCPTDVPGLCTAPGHCLSRRKPSHL